MALTSGSSLRDDDPGFVRRIFGDEFKAFRGVLDAGGMVRGINAKGQAAHSEEP